MAEPPVVSICCITYNHAPYIRMALDGFVSQQADFPFEIVVHDDASTDGTAEIILEYAAKYPDLIRPLIQTVNQYSQEPGRVTKIVLGAARGQFIAWCEGDDRWTDSSKLQDQLDVLRADTSAVGCFTDGWNELNGERTDYIAAWLGSKRPGRKVFLEDILGNNFVPTASLVYRRSAQSPLPANVQRGALGDQALHVQLLLSGHYIFLDRKTCVRHVHHGGIISMKSALYKLEANIRTLDAVQEMLDAPMTEKLEERLALYMERVVPIAARTGHPEKARHYLSRLLKMQRHRLPLRVRLRLWLFTVAPGFMDARVRRGQQRMGDRS